MIESKKFDYSRDEEEQQEEEESRPLTSRDSTRSHTASIVTGSAADSFEASLQRGFVQKVYGILLAQLAMTFAIVACFVWIPSVGEYVRLNSWVYWTLVILSLVMIVVMACAAPLMRKFPTNYVLLFTFTLFEGLLVGVISSFYTSDAVLIAFGILAAVVVGLTAFAAQTRWDFTGAGPYLFMGVWLLIIFGIFCAIFQTRVLTVVYCSLGVALFSIYLIYDTQRIVGGKHGSRISLDEYCYGALALYLDIINLFLMILGLVGGNR